jgi:T-complex protein 1 subunit alpha
MGLLYCFLLQVIVAAELLKNADELVKQKIHPTSIISGYRLACK